ncbi:MAG TPA: long-chain fatty acid--CoA ligase [Oligoflexia bacterium]|nr:long-chain fatty acid--CoA ligase [Oligoflexia bacterium]HMR24908.1 long-chain fatty acid--CoA ligase [Oligoflexia bacterium]
MNKTFDQQQTVPSIFFRHVHKHARKPVFADYINDSWQWLSWQEAAQIIASYALHLQSLGIEKGDTVAIMGENSSAWIMADLAIQSLGAVTVPLYPSGSRQQTEYILNHANVKIALLGESVLSHPAFKTLGHYQSLKHVLSISPKTTLSSPIPQLDKTNLNNNNINILISHINSIDPESLSSIIYTSGTTGQPKGVMLSHKNIFFNAWHCSRVVDDIGPNDCHLAFLPLCHAFERTAASYTCMMTACKIAFADDINKVSIYLGQVNPSLMFTVPRVLEKVHTAILNKLHPMPLRIGKLILQYIELNSDPVNMSNMKFSQKLLLALLKKTFFKRIAHKFGKRLRYIVSGGAALNPDLSKFFKGIGLVILQGYGQTEASPVISTNRPDNPKTDTVGPPLPDVIYKIDPESHELMVKGPSIMMGYYKNDEATQNAFSEDGYLKTGDIAQIDADGHIVITDRIKDIIVSSGGKNIAPSPIENALKSNPYIENACVIGEGRKYLSVLIAPDHHGLEQWIKRRQLKHLLELNSNERLQQPEILKHYQAIIDTINDSLASYETLKYFTLLEEAFCQENNTLTPTLKLKRKEIRQHYKQQIDAMYR